MKHSRLSLFLLIGMIALAGCAANGEIYQQWKRPTLRVSPKIQLGVVGKPVTFVVHILGQMPPAVIENLVESPDGKFEPGHRAIFDPHGKRVHKFTITFHKEYFTLMRQRSGWDPSVLENRSWDGDVRIKVLIRAPRPEDFQGSVNRDTLRQQFGRLDGKIYARNEVVIKLSCHSCIAGRMIEKDSSLS